MSNYSTVSNDQTDAKQRDRQIGLAVAGYQRLIEVIAAARTPEFPDSHLSMSQMKVLMLLGLGGEARMSDLAPRLGISLSTLSSHVDRLVEAGFVGRRDDPRDRRNVLLSIAPSGAEMLDTFQELGIRHLRELLSQLDTAGLKTVNHAIDLLVDAARQMTPEDPK